MTGILETVSISPRVATLNPGERKVFTVRAFDARGAVIPIEVDYIWQVPGKLASIEPEDSRATLEAGPAEGEGKIVVLAHKENKRARAEARFTISKASKKVGSRRLPHPEPISRHGEQWRSRYVSARNVIEYNTSHPNYTAANERGTKSRIRYIALLIAKELVLQNFRGMIKEGPLLERMVEVVTNLQAAI